jgi:hypothetical protein
VAIFTAECHDASLTQDNEKEETTDYTDYADFFIFFFIICVNLCNLWTFFMAARHNSWRRHPETNENQHKRICAAYRVPAPRGFHSSDEKKKKK